MAEASATQPFRYAPQCGWTPMYRGLGPCPPESCRSDLLASEYASTAFTSNGSSRYDSIRNARPFPYGRVITAYSACSASVKVPSWRTRQMAPARCSSTAASRLQSRVLLASADTRAGSVRYRSQAADAAGISSKSSSGMVTGRCRRGSLAARSARMSSRIAATYVGSSPARGCVGSGSGCMPY